MDCWAEMDCLDCQVEVDCSDCQTEVDCCSAYSWNSSWSHFLYFSKNRSTSRHLRLWSCHSHSAEWWCWKDWSCLHSYFGFRHSNCHRSIHHVNDNRQSVLRYLEG